MDSKLISVVFLVTIVAFHCLGTELQAQSPRFIPFSSVLNSTETGPIDVAVSIFDTNIGGTELWTETHSQITVQNNRLNLMIGSVENAGVPPGIFESSDPLYLEIRINNVPLLPRAEMGSVGHAIVADGIMSEGVIDALSEEGLKVGIGIPNPVANLEVQGSARSDLSNPHTRLLGVGTGWQLLSGLSWAGSINAGHAWIQSRHANEAVGNLLLNPLGGIVGIGRENLTNAFDFDVSAGAIRLGIDKKGGGELVIGNLVQNDDIITLAGFSSQGQTTASEIRITGAGDRLLPAINLRAENTNTGGNLNVGNTLTKQGGSFRIDHPLDPGNKYLSHSFVESPDMMNVYNGNIILGDNGEALVVLPDWFDALNKDFRYQLTCIGGHAPVYVKEEIANNQFRIAGGYPGLKVSWMVTGIRQDAYARDNPIVVEQEKPAEMRGTYLYSGAHKK